MTSTYFPDTALRTPAFAALSPVATAAPAADYPTRSVESDRESLEKVLAQRVTQK